MKVHQFTLFWSVIILIHTAKVASAIQDFGFRRILHQPLYPASSAPPPVIESSPPPPPDSSVFPDPDQPFFPEQPSGPTLDQNRPPPTSVNGTIPIAAAAQASKPTKKVAIAVSVGIVTLGMLSALAFFLYRHRAKHPGESQSQKLVGGSSQRFTEESRVPPSNFLYIGTVEPSNRRSTNDANGTNEVNGSPYHKLVSDKRSERYRPSPELQPLPPLSKPPPNGNSPSAMSSSDEESYETTFYTPQSSSVSIEDGYCTPVKRQGNPNNHRLAIPAKAENHSPGSVPHSKRTSPKSRLAASSPDMRQTIIPSIKQAPIPQPPPLPPAVPPQLQHPQGHDSEQASYHYTRPKFSAPPPAPNMALLQSLNPPSLKTTEIPSQGPPRPPPPPPPLSSARKFGPQKTSIALTPTQTPIKPQSKTPSPKTISGSDRTKPEEQADKSASNSGKVDTDDTDDTDGAKPKLKPLHWDKVRATSDRETVWDQLKASSFQLNEDMMETLFGCSTTTTTTTTRVTPKEPSRKLIFPPVEQDRVLDPKKSQNIAILLRAWNVTRDEVSEALLDGNPEGLGAELLETLVKMAPTKEEEIKLRNHSVDISKLGTAERFLKTVLEVPFAFKRVEAMLYRANFDAEVKYLRKSFQTLETASEELKNSRLFLKLLEAVLRTGNRMNVGTNRGDARSFKLDTLLKLVDIKGTDGKTTLLHFVVQEIIRSEGAVNNSTSDNLQNTVQFQTKEDDFKKHGLQVVAGLSRDLSNVKKAAGMDFDVLSSYVSKLELGLEKVRLVLQYEKPDMQGNFFASMKLFLKESEEEIIGIKSNERKALSLVKEVTTYFHGDAAKEEAHPLRIFMIVRDFLSVLDHVCKEVSSLHDRTVVGAARSFRISSTASLPVLNRYNVRHDNSSDEESSSP